MPSFILRHLDPEFWSRVQTKAKAEGVPIKALILRLLASWLATVLLMGVVGCASQLPTRPDAVTPAVQTTPASIRLTLATRPDRTYDVTATLLTADGHFVPDVALVFAMDVGSVTPETAMTNRAGVAQAIAATTSSTTLIVSAGSVTASTHVEGVPGPVPIPPIPPTPPTPLPPPSVGLAPVTATAGTAAFLTVGSFMGGGLPVASTIWAFGDGGTGSATGGSISHTYQAAGSFTASVTATDSQGRRASTSAIVTVQAAQLAATLTSTPAATMIGGTLTFTAAVSQLAQPTEAVTAYQWDLDGDGTYESITAAATRTSAPYPTAGIFTAKVLITTSAGRSVVASVGFAIRN